jgi:hypothetical protein
MTAGTLLKRLQRPLADRGDEFAERLLVASPSLAIRSVLTKPPFHRLALCFLAQLR